jgi:hypothetical protein
VLALAARAPRASMHPPVWRAHLSRFVIWSRDHESQNQIVCASGRSPARNVEGPPGDPVGGPSARYVCVHVTRWRCLRRYPYRNPSGRGS